MFCANPVQPPSGIFCIIQDNQQFLMFQDLWGDACFEEVKAALDNLELEVVWDKSELTAIQESPQDSSKK